MQPINERGVRLCGKVSRTVLDPRSVERSYDSLVRATLAIGVDSHDRPEQGADSRRQGHREGTPKHDP